MPIPNGKRKLKDISSDDIDCLDAPLLKTQKTSVNGSRLSLSRLGKG